MLGSPRKLTASLALAGALVVMLSVAYLTWGSDPAASTTASLPDEFPAFDARVTFERERGSTVSTGHLEWRDPRNWVMRVYGPDGQTLLQTQSVVGGVLTIGNATYNDETVFGEVANRSPGPWLITSSTALGRGASRDDGTVFTLRADRVCANEPAIAALCDGRQTITETTEHEFQPETGIPVRYSVYLDGRLVEEVRLEVTLAN